MMLLGVFVAVAASFVVQVVAGASPATPQFHLSLAGDGSGDYMLDWVTGVDATASVVYYGTAKDQLTLKATGTSSGNVVVTSNTSVQCWNARLSNLNPGAPVYYDLTSSSTSAKSFTPSAAITSWVIFGDMGTAALKKASGITLTALKQDLEKNLYGGILNIGDLAYELVELNGDQYMQQLEPITSVVPMQTTIGNHEMQYAAFGAMPNYLKRFAGQISGVGAASGSMSNRFYSFNSGLVHFVVMDTEVYGDEAYMTQADDGLWKPSEDARKKAQDDQAAWLEYDLSRVKRRATPFVVLCGHRPPNHIPNSVTKPNNLFAAQILPVLDKYSVDLMFFGHEHAYYSVDATPIGKYTMPPFIITGAAGNNEFIRPPSQVGLDPVFKLRKNINEYGYGYLKVAVDKLSWTWGQAATDSPGGTNPSTTAWTLADSADFAKKDVADPVPAGKPIADPTGAPKTTSSSSNNGTSTAPSSGGNGGGASTPSTTAKRSSSRLAPPIAMSIVVVLLAAVII
ncbi:unnamed protein product [Aphanomyces euteiches]|uniref:Purple acid phosphatase n=1 Tax=Aphanomyces euteiches TaxID=100861 RepID=A0A6G0W8S9_9STRA|nr:hypothetical protein Ae201684_017475 [Aphanomyces euteiches]KAH9085308.1 hypothetical protein Ae201684P_005018 [Aphanomyces euteiches]KAH9141473.1 hypothetical protein AeRB84_014345 [Aphanomyces euteiches]